MLIERDIQMIIINDKEFANFGPMPCIIIAHGPRSKRTIYAPMKFLIKRHHLRSLSKLSELHPPSFKQWLGTQPYTIHTRGSLVILYPWRSIRIAFLLLAFNQVRWKGLYQQALLYSSGACITGIRGGWSRFKLWRNIRWQTVLASN